MPTFVYAWERHTFDCAKCHLPVPRSSIIAITESFVCVRFPFFLSQLYHVLAQTLTCRLTHGHLTLAAPLSSEPAVCRRLQRRCPSSVGSEAEMTIAQKNKASTQIETFIFFIVSLSYGSSSKNFKPNVLLQVRKIVLQSKYTQMKDSVSFINIRMSKLYLASWGQS